MEESTLEGQPLNSFGMLANHRNGMKVDVNILIKDIKAGLRSMVINGATAITWSWDPGGTNRNRTNTELILGSCNGENPRGEC